MFWVKLERQWERFTRTGEKHDVFVWKQRLVDYTQVCVYARSQSVFMLRSARATICNLKFFLSAPQVMKAFYASKYDADNTEVASNMV